MASLGWRVVACIPAGRRRRMEPLVMHLRAQRPLVDEVHLWMNTVDPDDDRWLRALAADDSFFRIVERHPDATRSPMQANISTFYAAEHADALTVFVRLDDDIVWMAPDAIERLVAYRLANQRPLVVFGNIVNNAMCAWYHQQGGALPANPRLSRYCMDETSWRSPWWARLTHELFLNDIAAGHESRWLYAHRPLISHERFSISVFAWLSTDYDRAWSSPDLFLAEEEGWICHTAPKELDRPNHMCGDALFAHYSFFPQRNALDSTDVLDRYLRVAQDRQHDAYLRLMELQ